MASSNSVSPVIYNHQINLMLCPACHEHIYANLIVQGDVKIETVPINTIASKLSSQFNLKVVKSTVAGVEIRHQCKDGHPVSSPLLRTDTGLPKGPSHAKH